MDSNDDLRGAEANPGGAMANQIAALQLQVAELTQMLQSGVKMEAVSGADRQSVKDALESLDGGDLFNEAVAVQYSQAKMQQQQTQRECCSYRGRCKTTLRYGRLHKLSMFRSTSGVFPKLSGNTSGS